MFILGLLMGVSLGGVRWVVSSFLECVCWSWGLAADITGNACDICVLVFGHLLSSACKRAGELGQERGAESLM